MAGIRGGVFWATAAWMHKGSDIGIVFGMN